MSDFLPETSTQTMVGGVRGLYRLFAEQSFRPVCDPKTKKAILFKSATEAIAAAKEVLRRKLNPDLKAIAPEEPEADPDILGIEEWRKKQQEHTAVVRALKNGKNHRPVIVERKARRGKRNGSIPQ